IGGTNGKGSTSNMLSSILQTEGYKVGLYNSPHLIDFTERIKVNGNNCDKKFVFDFIQKLKKLPENIRPSFFEFTTIMAFEYFKQQNVDFAIIEVGLGGRLDSTNIIKPLVTAITNVELDHMDILGNTKELIAKEKAGIIKKNTPIISGDEDEIVKNIISEKAKENGADFIDTTRIQVNYLTDLQGNYQGKNIKVVLGLVNELRKLGILIKESSVVEGLENVQKNTNFIGRWYEFSKKPLTICDTGHNEAGLTKVFQQLNEMLQHKHDILGFVNDKKIDHVLEILPNNSTFYFVKPSINRAKNPLDYEDELKKAGIDYKIFQSVQEGYLSALQRIKNNEIIFIGGINFVVGDFLQKNLQK
ncbi:MAG: bifunctional folylpolyglutamate synthase/dihydrofolate synthase, partial [Bacteroidetes bacterium]|nr:bifunctional folylpolyglutamate synthase/dihydrofolate synthase [Bacteroidota bacterium]